MDSKNVTLNDLLPIIKEKLAENGSVLFTTNGTSMKPLLDDGKDQVELVKVDGPLKRNDIPLFSRQDGTFVLHRIVKVLKDNNYLVRGDNQIINEKINHQQIIGKVCKIVKNNQEIDFSSKKYKRYLFSLHFKYPFRYIYHKIAKIFRQKGK